MKEQSIPKNCSKEQSIKVVLVKAGERAQIVTVPNTLETFQHIVDDIITLFYLDDTHAIICGDNAKIYGKPLKRAIYDENRNLIEVIAGDFLIVDASGEDFKSLASADALKFTREFELPEDIFLLGNHIMAIPYEPF